MSETAASTPLIALHALSASVWVGGLVAIFVVARTAAATLDAPTRVAFFRTLGRSYGVVGSVALVIALTTGALLLRGHPLDRLLIATAIVAAALLVATLVGITQARAMTRLRRKALTGAGGVALDPRIRRGAVLAAALRGAIAILTFTLVVLGAALAG